MIRLQKNTPTKKIAHRSEGFTLIELIIVVSIVLLLVGGGMAAFVRFNDRQKVQATVSEVEQLLRIAQTRARVRDNSDQAACTLQGYRVVTNGSTVEMRLLCGATKFAVTAPTLRDSFTVPSGVTLTSMQIDFYTLAGSANVTSPVDNEIRINGSNSYYMFRIEDTGEIGQGCFVTGATSDVCGEATAPDVPEDPKDSGEPENPEVPGLPEGPGGDTGGEKGDESGK
jgi:prepilin-type N-terminal cleavage/methylation domain-containing protein